MKKTLKQMSIAELEELLETGDDLPEQAISNIEKELQRKRDMEKPTVHHGQEEEENDD